jgi:hypothetical protein
MNSNDFLQIKYEAFFSNDEIEDFQDLELFERGINENYNSFVKAMGVGRGGGVYQLVFHFISNLDLSSYLQIVAGYLAIKIIDKAVDKSLDKAIDKIKENTGKSEEIKDIEKYLFIPLQNEYKKLKKSNPMLDYYSFQIELKDINIFIYKTCEDSLISNLNEKIAQINRQWQNIKMIYSDEQPHFKVTEIHIPAIPDILGDRKIYRTPMGDEETKQLDQKDYFECWGINYFHNQLSGVYDVKNKTIIRNYDFYTKEHFEYE